MIPAPAQYLLRFDDLCPAMDRSRWQPFLSLVERYRIQPILAIVPENLDRDLEHAAPAPDFWNQMRELQAAGAAIGLHGFHHLCVSPGRSLLPFHRSSEFAGVEAERQRQWIRAGLEILRGKGLTPRLWIAPRHGFDRHTLHALQEAGIAALSDGLTRRPILRGGMAWIPQQLWAPVEKSRGLWTICIHTNTASQALVTSLDAFLDAHVRQFTSLDRVLQELPADPPGLCEQLREKLLLLRMAAKQRWKHDV